VQAVHILDVAIEKLYAFDARAVGESVFYLRETNSGSQ
jgi:hypothetical protein